MKTAIGVVSVALALSGCATPEFAPIKDSMARIEAYGFSILPPPGTGWHRGKDRRLNGSYGVSFAKQSGSKTHTLAATVSQHSGFDPASVGFAEYAEKPEVFAAYVKAATQHMNPPGGRLKILALTATPDTQYGYCVKEHAKFEDHASPSAPPYNSQILFQEDWLYSCLHPDSPRVIVEMVFSERGLPGESDASLMDVRERFFKSVQFRPLK